MPHGYNGKILHVDLTHGTLTVEEPSEKFYRTYMGGSAMGLYYILKEMKPGIDPLGPDNMLTLMLSALTGAPISGQSRLTATTPSNRFHRSNAWWWATWCACARANASRWTAWWPRAKARSTSR